MELMSPKYKTHLIKEIAESIWREFKSYQEVLIYIQSWYYTEPGYDSYFENFEIVYRDLSKSQVDLLPTLANMDAETLIRVAIDMGVDTPDFIPSVPTFRNVIKEEAPTASVIFEKAYKIVETEPDTAIGLANSVLESIVKEMLKDCRISTTWKENDTLYSLLRALLKEFKLMPSVNMPEEIKTIGSSLAAIAQGIEKLRSDKTCFHGKMEGDYFISDSMYAYFVINSICSVAMFLKSFYKKHFPPIDNDDFLPF